MHNNLTSTQTVVFMVWHQCTTIPNLHWLLCSRFDINVQPYKIYTDCCVHGLTSMYNHTTSTLIVVFTVWHQCTTIQNLHWLLCSRCDINVQPYKIYTDCCVHGLTSMYNHTKSTLIVVFTVWHQCTSIPYLHWLLCSRFDINVQPYNIYTDCCVHGLTSMYNHTKSTLTVVFMVWHQCTTIQHLHWLLCSRFDINIQPYQIYTDCCVHGVTSMYNHTKSTLIVVFTVWHKCTTIQNLHWLLCSRFDINVHQYHIYTDCCVHGLTSMYNHTKSTLIVVFTVWHKCRTIQNLHWLLCSRCDINVQPYKIYTDCCVHGLTSMCNHTKSTLIVVFTVWHQCTTIPYLHWLLCSRFDINVQPYKIYTDCCVHGVTSMYNHTTSTLIVVFTVWHQCTTIQNLHWLLCSRCDINVQPYKIYTDCCVHGLTSMYNHTKSTLIVVFTVWHQCTSIPYLHWLLCSRFDINVQPYNIYTDCCVHGLTSMYNHTKSTLTVVFTVWHQCTTIQHLHWLLCSRYDINVQPYNIYTDCCVHGVTSMYNHTKSTLTVVFMVWHQCTTIQHLHWLLCSRFDINIQPYQIYTDCCVHGVTSMYNHTKSTLIVVFTVWHKCTTIQNLHWLLCSRFDINVHQYHIYTDCCVHGLTSMYNHTKSTLIVVFTVWHKCRTIQNLHWLLCSRCDINVQPYKIYTDCCVHGLTSMYNHTKSTLIVVFTVWHQCTTIQNLHWLLCSRFDINVQPYHIYTDCCVHGLTSMYNHTKSTLIVVFTVWHQCTAIQHLHWFLCSRCDNNVKPYKIYTDCCVHGVTSMYNHTKSTLTVVFTVSHQCTTIPYLHWLLCSRCDINVQPYKIYTDCCVHGLT